MDNTETVASLLQKLAGTLVTDDARHVIIFGSSAIALHGVDLGRAVHDLDVFVSGDIFQRLSSRYPVKEKPAKEGGMIPYIKPIDDASIEVLRSFPGVTFEEVAKRAAAKEGSFGFSVGSLLDLRTWKTAQGRDKDLADLKAIDNFSRLASPTS